MSRLPSKSPYFTGFGWQGKYVRVDSLLGPGVFEQVLAECRPSESHIRQSSPFFLNPDVYIYGDLTLSPRCGCLTIRLIFKVLKSTDSNISSVANLLQLYSQLYSEHEYGWWLTVYRFVRKFLYCYKKKSYSILVMYGKCGTV